MIHSPAAALTTAIRKSMSRERQITSVFARERVGVPEACCVDLTVRKGNCSYLRELLTYSSMSANTSGKHFNLPFNVKICLWVLTQQSSKANCIQLGPV